MMVLDAAGKFSLGKGTHVLAEAVPLIRGQVPQTSFVLFGRRADWRHALPSDVELREPVAHDELLHDWIPRADVCVHPAVWPEPYSRVVLEYLAAGKAVVATTVGGIPEQIRHGVTGWLVPRSDVQALAEAVSWLLTDDEARWQLGHNALMWSVGRR